MCTTYTRLLFVGLKVEPRWKWWTEWCKYLIDLMDNLNIPEISSAVCIYMVGSFCFMCCFLILPSIIIERLSLKCKTDLMLTWVIKKTNFAVNLNSNIEMLPSHVINKHSALLFAEASWKWSIWQICCQVAGGVVLSSRTKVTCSSPQKASSPRRVLPLVGWGGW